MTGFGYDHGEAWSQNMEFFKHFTDVSRGVRRLGSAAVDLCHVALGITESYHEFYLKPWDVCAGGEQIDPVAPAAASERPLLTALLPLSLSFSFSFLTTTTTTVMGMPTTATRSSHG